MLPMAMPGYEAEVEAEIDALADLGLIALRERWRAFYGSEPPVRMSPELMLRAVAYRIQEEAFGGLSRSLKAKLMVATGQSGNAGVPRNKHSTGAPASGNTVSAFREISPDSDLSPASCSRPIRPSRARKDRRVKAGTKFIREWNGRMIEVIAMADGRYLYAGGAYRSLSAIARQITGTRWSGPAFFGIGTKPGGARGKG